MRVRTRFYYQGNLIPIITGTELQKKLGMEISNLFSCPSSFFRKENNKESPGKIQQNKTNLNTGQKWGNC